MTVSQAYELLTPGIKSIVEKNGCKVGTGNFCHIVNGKTLDMSFVANMATENKYEEIEGYINKICKEGL